MPDWRTTNARFLVTLFLLFIPLMNYSLEYLAENLSTQHGLSENSITALFQDRDGFLWVGTKQGLNRYEGTHFFTFTEENGLAQRMITAITQDAAGAIWVGTNKGLFKFENQAFSSYTQEQGLPDHRITCLTVDAYGILVVGTKSGLSFYKNGLFINYTAEDGDFSNDEITTVYAHPNNTIWVGTRDATLLFKDYAVHTRFGNPSVEPIHVISIIQDSLDQLLFSTQENGIYRYTGSQFERVSSYGALQVAALTPVRFLKDKQGNLVFATEYQGCYYKSDSVAYSQFTLPESNTYATKITQGICDHEGIIWLGTQSHGLIKLYPRRVFDVPFSNADKNFYVTSIQKDHQGRIWIGTPETIGYFTPDYSQFHPVASIYCTDIVVDNNGVVWASGNGIWRLTPEQALKIPLPAYLENQPIKTLAVAGSGALIFVSEMGGLYHMNVRTENVRWIAEDDFISMAHDPATGNVTILSRTQLFTYNEDNGLNALRLPGLLAEEKNFQCMHFITEHHILLGSDTLWIYKDWEAKPFNLEQKLEGGSILSLTQDTYGRIWMGTTKGVFVFDGIDFFHFDTHDGLAGSYCIPDSKLIDENLYLVGTHQGLSKIPITHLKINEREPTVRITAIHQENTSLLNPDGFHIPHDHSSFTIEVASLSLMEPIHNQYRYRLEGSNHSSHWTHLQGEQQITYSHLEPGTYTFIIYGTNNDGIWSSSPATLTIVVSPPFWLSIWFFMGIGILIIAGLFVLVKWGLRVDRHQQHKLEKQNKTLTALDKQKEAFLVNTSKELIKPLESMLQVVDDLMDGKTGELAPQTISELTMVHLNTKRLLHMIQDIESFTQLRANELLLKNEPVELRRVADTVIYLSRPLWDRKGIKAVNNIEHPITILSDESRILQILYTLYGHILQNIHQGTLAFHAEFNKGMVEIRITGIPSQTLLHKMEEVVWKGATDDSLFTTLPMDRTDMGLLMTRFLIKRLSGNIRMDKDTDSSYICIRFPSAPVEMPQFKSSKPALVS